MGLFDLMNTTFLISSSCEGTITSCGLDIKTQGSAEFINPVVVPVLK